MHRACGFECCGFEFSGFDLFFEPSLNIMFEQVLRTCFRTRFSELVRLRVSAFECRRTRNLEVLFLNVCVFANMFELVVSIAFERNSSG